ncbi:MAG: type II toxin-antitoxin system RelE/ParE family toxin [Oscillospiraceae bacterium]|nr:type II toxin-antitoxin system RelE/ParE family toxin [Oscillospiraceae bacterium]
MDDKYTVKLMSRALRDLDGIYAYIAKTLLEPETALKLVDTLEGEILTLDSMPYRCPERQTGAYANKGYRQLLVKNYTVVYRIDEKQKAVIIVTVRYSPSQF